jgi:GNAT superfamily N-acetyltransferase
MEIAKARPEDSRVLTNIAFESKRHWGYPDEYFEVWKAELTITPEYIIKNEVFVALSAGEIAGFYSLLESGGETWLDHMFLKPAFIGKGMGTMLIRHMISVLGVRGIGKVRIYADPHAEGFYRKMGAELEKRVESSIKGRELPIYRLDIEKGEALC